MSKTANETEQKILIADKIHQDSIDLLEQLFEVDVTTGLSEDELCDIIEDYQAIVVRSATKVTERVIEKAFNLRVIARAGAGLDNINIVAAKTQGIEVVNSPNANTQAVAEHTMGLILALARRLPEADSSLKRGQWNKSSLMGTGLYGQTLGIIGFGKIGREVARRALVFGMNVIANQRRLTPELALEEGVKALDLVELLKTSDFVTLHIPSKPETVGLIGPNELALMKPSAYLINTARGEIVDENALLKALNDNKLAGAALDVFAQEPATDSALAQHSRVIATPHIAASTGDAQRAAGVTVAEQIVEILTASVEANPLSLQILPAEKVFPHEQTDPTRIERLTQRLKKDNVLKNPPIVTEWKGNYVVLDGATRVTALKALDYKYLAAQVVPYTGHNLSLQGWHHIIEGISETDLMSLIEDLPDVSSVPGEVGRIHDQMVEFGGFCHLLLPEHRVYIIRPALEANRLDALNNFVSAYINATQVSRTLHSDFNAVNFESPDATGLFVFPTFTVAQILEIAAVGKEVPAGITRFIIPGRVLRLNLDLAGLKKDEPRVVKSAWLNQIVHKLIANHKVRYYEEPVYLLDE